MPTSPALAYLQGLGLGGGLIVAIGAQNAFVLRQGLRRRHVLPVVAVCFLADATLIAVGVAGFGGLVAAFPALTTLAAWGGALFLFAYGLLAFRAALRPGVLEATDGDEPDRRRAVLAALGFSLLNPHVYLDTVILIGGIAGSFGGVDRLVFGMGAVSASGLWFAGLGYGARLLAPLFARPAAWRALDLVIGVVMWTIAFSLIVG